MPTTDGDSVVLWTGGKDSVLALVEAREQGVDVRALVTFVPPDGKFKAHPCSLMRAQADSLGLPHRSLMVDRPYAGSYEQMLRGLRDEGVRYLYTGDIAEVQGHTRWLQQRVERTGLDLRRPLWGRDRRGLLEHALKLGLRPVVTAVRSPHLSDDWVGKPLDRSAVEELASAPPERAIDLSGERGEYHTMVLYGPGFHSPLTLGPWSLVREGDLRYAKLELWP